jgi:protein TonB
MADVLQLPESRRSRIGRWAAAAIIACALHVVGAALALMHWQQETSDDPAGGLIVELAPLPAVMPVDSPDVAHGPDQQVAKMTPEAAKQVVEKVQKDIPVVEPSRMPDPEVALPKPEPDEKEQPKEEEVKEAVSEKEEPPQEKEHELTTAPPRVEAQPAPSSAPAQGPSPVLARANADWKNALSRQLNRHKRVPQGAGIRRGQWEAVVAFTVDQSGRLASVELRKSTGVPALDKEALEWLQRASPFPPPPDVPGIELYFTQSIRFDVK